ncbi:MAG TPA: hypothetical protein VM734_33555, partial [Kofleriaceae bacterium]|nr:hypothetical protein [Kofleriaceae bacterium]
MHPGARPGGPPTAPIRSGGGTPKIVPILVSMLVAGGTFSGLYFGLGTGTEVQARERPAGVQHR